MKNFLIPSILESDTITAVRVAIQQSKGKKSTVYLLLVNEIPDSFSSTTYLRSMKSDLSPTQKKVLDYCRELITISQNCSLKIHYQYGISAPLMKNLIKHLDIELTILSTSYKLAKKKIHHQFIQILGNNKCPILHLNPNCDEFDLTKAMYLEQNLSKLQLEDILQLIPENFNFRIVSKAKIFDNQNPEELQSLLKDSISKNNIDLLIETRKPKKVKFKNNNSNATESLDLPILSLYEEIN